MKTLLLVLVVVGFVHLDSGAARMCYKCNGTVCDLNGNCAEGETKCFILRDKSDTNGFRDIKGCATTCPTPGTDQEVKCCSVDYCNRNF